MGGSRREECRRAGDFRRTREMIRTLCGMTSDLGGVHGISVGFPFKPVSTSDRLLDEILIVLPTVN